MAEGNNESYSGISLSGVHKRLCLGVPIKQSARPWFGICDEADIAIVEPIPIFPAATYRGRPGRGLLIRKIVAPFVIFQVITRGVPLVIAPRRHIGGDLGPNRNIVVM